MPQFPIAPGRSALLFFDMINHFVRPENAEQRRWIEETGIIGHAVEILTAARQHGLLVAYASGSYRPGVEDGSQVITDANMMLRPWPDGSQVMNRTTAVEGTSEAQVIDELAPRPTDHLIQKARWSAFAGTPLDLLLRGLRIDTVLLAGVATDVGVAATMFDGRDRGYNMIVIRDACATPIAGSQEFCMERLFPRMGRVLTAVQAASLMQATE